MLTYAGQYLAECTAELAAMIATHISPAEVFDFQRLDWPGANRTGWTFPGTLRKRGVVVNSLYWPRDASRWAIGYFLATTNTLAAIRQQLQGTGYTDPYTGDNVLYGSAPLVISEENQAFQTVGKITAAQMYMLPARPLLDVTGQQGIYLITLVDDRYFWWFRDSGDIVLDETTSITWGGLYDLAAQALGVNIAYDTINSAYGLPGYIASQYEQTPLLLDAIAYNVGQRIVVGLDGTVYAFNQSTSQTVLDNTLGLLSNAQPGVMYFTGGGFVSDDDISLLIPSGVKVTFPQSVSYVDMGTKYPIEVHLTDLNINELGVVGNGNIKTFHDTAYAEGPTASAPTNLSTLTALTKQIATDWYLYQLGAVDGKFEGIVSWTPEGLSDAIEWMYVKGDVSTRVYRPAWNDLTEELLHGPAPFQQPAWIKVTSATPQTIDLTPMDTRSITAEINEDNYVLRSSDANFTIADLGASITGAGITGGTTIAAVNSPTEAVLSAVAYATISSATLTVTDTNQQLKYGYDAVVTVWNGGTGQFDDGTLAVWFYGVNNENPQPGVIYQCRLLGLDYQGISIWATEAIVPVIAILNSSTPNGDGLYDATINYYNPNTEAWSAGANIWLRDANQ